MMIIIEDSRQQANKHKNVHQFFERAGITLVRSKLLVGDYMIANRGNVSIDTKSGVPELMMDVWQQHRRFREECQLAQNSGILLIVLVEEVLPFGRLDLWRSPVYHKDTASHSKGEPMYKGNPATLRKALATMTKEYGVKFRFCDRKETGSEILRYLTEVKPIEVG